MKYVFVKKFETGEEAVSIIEDPVALFKSGEYNESRGDKLYQLGSEIKIEMNIKIKSEPVYRSAEAFGHLPGSRKANANLALKTEDGYNG